MEMEMVNTAKEYVKRTKTISLNAFQHKMQLNDSQTEELIALLEQQGAVKRKAGFVFRYVKNSDVAFNARTVARQYVKTVQEITYSALIDELRMEESDAREWVWNLVDNGVLQHAVGFLLEYVGEEDSFSSKTDIKEDDYVDDSDSDNDDDDFYYDPDDDEDEDDEDDEDDDEELDRILSRIHANDSQRAGADFMERLKYRRLASVASSFGCGGKYKKVGEEYYYDLGLTYPDDTEVQFKLFYAGMIIKLSDCGKTYRYMSKRFNMEEPEIEKFIEIVLSDYSLHWQICGEQRELCIRIRDEENAFCSFLWLYAAIERMVMMQENGLFRGIADDLESFCKKEIVGLVIGQNLVYGEAKARAQELYDVAEANGDEFQKQAYKNVIAAFNSVTEEGYEDFKDFIMEEVDD